jgi:hypothetical protein
VLHPNAETHGLDRARLTNDLYKIRQFFSGLERKLFGITAPVQFTGRQKG